MDENTREIAPVQAPAGNSEIMVQAVNLAIREVVMPFMASLSEMMKNNTEALQYLAAQQKVQTDRMEALEKQIRLNTLVTPTQAKYLSDAIRKRAKEILSKKNLEADRKATTKLSGVIRKAVLSRYGVSGIHDIPKHEYTIAMQQIETWNDIPAVMEITRDARKRASAAVPDYGEKQYSGLLEDDSHA